MENKKKKGMSVKLCATLLALAVVLGVAIGGTIAWLTAQTDPVVNTFTVGNIDIELWEPKYLPETNELDYDTWVTSNDNYKIVPGMDLPKYPFILVKEGSEPCWLFLKIDENNFIDGMSYETTMPWKPLEGEDHIYYRACTPTTKKDYFTDNVLNTDCDLYVLKGDKITVDGEKITSESLATIKDKEVSLNFTVYAIQYEGFPKVEDAWKVVKDTYLSGTSTTTAE